jgi:hypothetical protein
MNKSKKIISYFFIFISILIILIPFLIKPQKNYSLKLDLPVVYSWIIKEENLKIPKNIDDIVLNSKQYPYLRNFIKNAINNPQINHYFFYYHESEKNKNNELIIQNINNEIKNFDSKLREIFKKNNLNYNIKIFHKDEIIEDLINIYKKNYQGKKNLKEIKHKLENIFQNKFIINQGQKNLATGKKIDFLKLLGALYAQEKENSGVLILDFDTDLDSLKINFNKNLILPKFVKWYGNSKKNFSNNPFKIELFSEALIFVPNNSFFKKFILNSIVNLIDNYSLGHLIFFLNASLIEKRNIDNIDKFVEYIKNDNDEQFSSEFSEYTYKFCHDQEIVAELKKTSNKKLISELENHFLRNNFFNNEYKEKSEIYISIFNEFKKYIKNFSQNSDIHQNNDFFNKLNISNKKKIFESFKNFYISNFYERKKKIHSTQVLSGIEDQIIFKNLNNQEFLHKQGQSWNKNIKILHNKALDIYQDTEILIKNYKKSKNKINHFKLF